MYHLKEDLYQIYQMPPTSILSNNFSGHRMSVDRQSLRYKFSPLKSPSNRNLIESHSLSVGKLIKPSKAKFLTNTINQENVRYKKLPQIGNKTSLTVRLQEKLQMSSRIFKNQLEQTDIYLQQTQIDHKAKDLYQNNKEIVSTFFNKYTNQIDRKDQVQKKGLKNDQKNQNIFLLEKFPQKPKRRLKQRGGSKKCITDLNITSFGDVRINSHYNLSSDSDVQEQKQKQSSDSDLDMEESDYSASDNGSDILAIDHDITEASIQVKRMLMPILDEESTGQEQFYSYIKKSDKINDLQKYFQFQDDTLYSQMANVQLSKNLFPRLVGVKQGEFNPRKIHLNKRHIGDKYMEALCVSFKSEIYQDIKCINLQENQITATGLKHLISHLPEGLTELNLQDNDIKYAGCMLLKPICADIFVKLKSLNVENNRIRDRGAIQLLDGLKESHKIQILNMSKNEITDNVASSIYDFLSQSKSLECFYMHWNLLKNQSGNAIAKALQRNPNLKVLDLSYNSMGSFTDGECISNWCKLIENTKSELTHLDISYNKLTMEELRLISLALLLNHTIFGLHVEGNQYGCVVDSRGFLRFKDEHDLQESYEARSQKKYRIDGANYVTQQSDSIEQIIDLNNCCWICQGWQEITFVWVPGKSGLLSTGPIFLHLDFESFSPLMMDDQLGQIPYNSQKPSKASSPVKKGKQILFYETNDQYLTFSDVKQQHLKEKYGEKALTQFTLKKMCPPNQRILYFFSNPLEEVQLHAVDQNQLKVKDQLDDLENFEFLDGTILPAQIMKFVNYVDTKQSFVLDDKSDYCPIVDVYPRDNEKTYALATKAKQVRRRKENIKSWNFEQSFFKDCILDNQTQLEQCFEFDYNCSKIPKFVKNEYERDKLKEQMMVHYHSLKDAFRYYSSNSLLQGYDTVCFPFGNFSKFIQESGVIDNIHLKVNDVDLDLLSVKINVDPAIINNPDKGLNRYQFLEIIFRMALDKYMRTQICRGFAEAFARIMKDGIEQKINCIEKIQDWREERYWTRNMDLLIKLKLGFLNKLFEFTSETMNKKWYFKVRWVSVKEFYALLFKTDLITDFMTDKDVYLIFNLSMMTQITEYSEDRSQKMGFTEFVEALARLAESLSPAPIGFNYENLTFPKKQAQSLHIKFEVLLTYFYHKIPLTDRDMFIELFSKEDPKISMPTSKNINKFYKSEAYPLTNDEQLKLNIVELDQHPLLDTREINYRLINPIGSIKYTEVFKEPHLHPQYQVFFAQEKQIVRQRRGLDFKQKRKIQQKALQKITKGFNMRKVG